MANTNKWVLFLPPSDAHVRSFLWHIEKFLLYTLIKLYYTKALSNPASSLAPDWIHLLRRPRIPRLIIQQQPFSITSWAAAIMNFLSRTTLLGPWVVIDQAGQIRLIFSYVCVSVLSHFSFVWHLSCSPPGSSVQGIFQARTLEWFAMPSSRNSSWLRDQTCFTLHFL